MRFSFGNVDFFLTENVILVFSIEFRFQEFSL